MSFYWILDIVNWSCTHTRLMILYILYMYASTNTEADCLHVCMYGCIHVLYRSVLHFIVVNIIYNRSLVNIAHISSSVQHFTIVFLWSGSDLLGWVWEFQNSGSLISHSSVDFQTITVQVAFLHDSRTHRSSTDPGEGFVTFHQEFLGTLVFEQQANDLSQFGRSNFCRGCPWISALLPTKFGTLVEERPGWKTKRRF